MTTLKKDWILEANNERLFRLQDKLVHEILDDNSKTVTGTVNEFELAGNAPFQVCSLYIENKNGIHEINIFDIDSIEIL